MTTHRMSSTRLYRIWRNMKQRCHNPNNTNYVRYGAKGVVVCDEWKLFENFMNWAFNHGYTDELTIDREDPNKGYEPNNCRWITHAENARRASIGRKRTGKPRNFVPITYNGITKTIKEWAHELDIPYKTLHRRLRHTDWPIEKAFTKPVRRHRKK